MMRDELIVGIKESLPSPPAKETALANSASVQPTASRVRHVVIGLVVATVLVLVSGLAYSPWQRYKLGILPAYAYGSDATLLMLETTEGDPEPTRGPALRQVSTQVMDVIETWAVENELTLLKDMADTDQTEFPPVDAIARIWNNRGSTLLYLSLIGVEQELIDELLSALAPVKGLAPVRRFAAMHIRSPRGHEFALPIVRVQVNDKDYLSPVDFTKAEEEMLALMWVTQDRNPLYMAFCSLDTQKDDRLGLGDICRIDRTADGIVFETVVDELGLSDEERQAVLSRRTHWTMTDHQKSSRMAGDNDAVSVGFFLPHGMDEAELDIPAEFEKLLNPEPRDMHEFSYRGTLRYELLPQEVLLSSTGAELVANPEPGQLAAAVRERIHAWLEHYPEYTRNIAFRQPIEVDEQRRGGVLIMLFVRIQTDDTALPDELAALLADIEGLPEPTISLREAGPDGKEIR